jgi:hypothetical protein
MLTIIYEKALLLAHPYATAGVEKKTTPTCCIPVREKNANEHKSPARNALKGNVPTSSMYANCSNSSSQQSTKLLSDRMHYCQASDQMHLDQMCSCSHPADVPCCTQ